MKPQKKKKITKKKKKLKPKKSMFGIDFYHKLFIDLLRDCETWVTGQPTFEDLFRCYFVGVGVFNSIFKWMFI